MFGTKKKNGETEVEIWVPNKKYSGALKEQFAEQMKKAQGESTPKRSPKTRAEKADKGQGQNFAQFETLSKTPSAFVRKAVAKVTPKSKIGKQIKEVSLI